LPPTNELCCFPSRSHLQPPSYGPVLSPMNKVHGGVNKLPSVNQLVGQPPPHSSAAGPNLGPMGKSLGQARPWEGWGDPREGLADDTWAFQYLPPPGAPAYRQGDGHRWFALSTPDPRKEGLCLIGDRSGVDEACLMCLLTTKGAWRRFLASQSLNFPISKMATEVPVSLFLRIK
jgi:hypothetical protein